MNGLLQFIESNCEAVGEPRPTNVDELVTIFYDELPEEGKMWKFTTVDANHKAFVVRLRKQDESTYGIDVRSPVIPKLICRMLLHDKSSLPFSGDLFNQPH